MWLDEIGAILIILVVVAVLTLGIYRSMKDFSKKKTINQTRTIISVIFAVLIIFVLLASVVTRLVNFVF